MQTDLTDLDEYEGLESNRDRHWEVHLRWMFENQPDLVRELARQKKLGLYLDRKYQEALALLERLEGSGVDRETAWETVYAQILAPAEALAENNQGPMPEAEQEQILANL